MSKYYSNTLRIISIIILIAFVCTQTALGYESNLRLQQLRDRDGSEVEARAVPDAKPGLSPLAQAQNHLLRSGSGRAAGVGEKTANSIGEISDEAKKELRIEKLDKYRPRWLGGAPLQFIGRYDNEIYELRVLPARSGNKDARDVEIVNLHNDKQGKAHLILAGFIIDLTIKKKRVSFEGLAIPDYKRIAGILGAKDIKGSFESKINMVLQESQSACPSVACEIILARYWVDSWAKELNKSPEELFEEQIYSDKNYNSGEIFMAFIEFLSSIMPLTAEFEWNSPNMMARGQLHLEGDPAKSSMARMTEVYGFATYAERVDNIPALIFKKTFMRLVPKPPILIPIKWKSPDKLGSYLLTSASPPARATNGETLARAEMQPVNTDINKPVGDSFEDWL